MICDFFVEICPRCGCTTFERLATHDHCWNCNFSSAFNAKKTEDDLIGLIWAEEYLRQVDEKRKMKGKSNGNLKLQFID